MNRIHYFYCIAIFTITIFGSSVSLAQQSGSSTNNQNAAILRSAANAMRAFQQQSAQEAQRSQQQMTTNFLRQQFSNTNGYGNSNQRYNNQGYYNQGQNYNNLQGYNNNGGYTSPSYDRRTGCERSLQDLGISSYQASSECSSSNFLRSFEDVVYCTRNLRSGSFSDPVSSVFEECKSRNVTYGSDPAYGNPANNNVSANPFFPTTIGPNNSESGTSEESARRYSGAGAQ